MPTSTSSSRPSQTLLALAGTIVLFLILRCVFFIIPGAFYIYPETLKELSFYSVDTIGRINSQDAQVILQGTSRFQMMGTMPVLPSYQRTGGTVLNLSISGGTPWHIAALRRMNPELWDSADLVITDIAPMQIYIGPNFDETDVLFFRHSSLAEKWLIHSLSTRACALVDWIVPIWSMRYKPYTWWRALNHLDATNKEKLATLQKTDPMSFPEFREWIAQLDQVRGDQDKIMYLFLDLNFPVGGSYSRVQEHALRELSSNPPPNGYLVLFHPPYADKLNRALYESPARRQIMSRLRELAESMISDKVVLKWFDDADQLAMTESDFANDGLHFTLETGNTKVREYLTSLYPELFQIPPAEVSTQ